MRFYVIKLNGTCEYYNGIKQTPGYGESVVGSPNQAYIIKEEKLAEVEAAIKAVTPRLPYVVHLMTTVN